VRQFVAYAPIDKVLQLPRGLRGIYVLYQEEPPRRRRAKPNYNVVYVGMARQGGIRWRLRRQPRIELRPLRSRRRDS
jgi:hypothetical protein